MSSILSNLELLHDPSYPTISRRFRPVRPKVHVHSLNGSWKLSKETKEITRARKLKREMQVKNMKLYMMNKIIVEENEKLRRKAMVLLQENKILQAQIQKLPHVESKTNKY